MKTLSADQFARVKALFDRLVDLPAADRRTVLDKLDEAPEVLAELHLLLGNTLVDDARYAGPVLAAMLADQPAAVSEGTVLGAWTLGAEIGEGGMGKVFAAERSDGHYEQSAAIKLLSGVASSQALRYLARERQILASLSHPNIARIIDGGSTPGGQPYIVMERVDGVPIDHFCAQHALPQDERLRLLIDVCGAVDFAHRQLIVHCDLKPSNILVTADGRPMLLDFGISRRLLESSAEDNNDDSATPAPRGTALTTSKAYTPRYASPEQINNDRVGTATDIYSLGRVMAELLGVPLDDRERLDLSSLPPDLAAIIALATAPVAGDRYASCAALAADLRRYLDHLPVSARPATVVYIGTRWLRRHWPWAAAGLAFVATIALFSWQMRAERDAALAAEQASRAVTGFMSSVFQAADPEVAGRRDLPVSELLDAGRDRLREQLQNQPLVQAEIAAILGGVYQSVGKRDQALALYDQAIVTLGAEPPPLLLADLLHRKAYTLFDLEDVSAAEPIARQALDLRQRHNADAAARVRSMRVLGTTLLYQGRREESQPLLEQALALAIESSGEESTDTARARLDLGALYGYYDISGELALEHGREAARVLEQIHGSDHPLYADALEVQVIGLNLIGDFQAAIPLARTVAEQRIRIYGERSPQAGHGLYIWAEAMGRAGHALDALPVSARALQIQQQLTGDDSFSVIAPLLQLAYLQFRCGLYESALASLDRLIQIHRRQQSAGSLDLIEAQFNRGRVLRALGRLDEAAEVTAHVLEQHRQNPETIPYLVARSQLEMAAVLRGLGRFDETQAQLQAIDRSAFGRDDWRRADLLLEQARLAAAGGRDQQALDRLLAGEALLESGLGAEHPEVWVERIDRAELLLRMDRPREAQELAAQIRIQAAPALAPDGLLQQRLDALP